MYFQNILRLIRNVLLVILAYNLDPSLVMKCRSNLKADHSKNLPCKVFLISFMECLPPSKFPWYLLEHSLFSSFKVYFNLHHSKLDISQRYIVFQNPFFVKRWFLLTISRINQEGIIAKNPAVNLWKKLTVWKRLVFDAIHWGTLHSLVKSLVCEKNTDRITQKAKTQLYI